MSEPSWNCITVPNGLKIGRHTLDKPVALYSTSRSFSKEDLRKHDVFHQIAMDFGGPSNSPATGAKIMSAFRYVLDFDINKYCEKLRQVMATSTPHHLIESRDTGITGTDDPAAVLNRLASKGKDNNTHNTLDMSRMDLFRQAWDQRSFCQMIDELMKHDAALDFDRTWGTGPGSQPWLQVINFCETVEAGDAWKKWCKCFSGSKDSDRGMLLLLLIARTPDTFLEPGLKLEMHGGDLLDHQIVWLSMYVQREMPDLNRLAGFLNPWALKLYRQGYLKDEDQLEFNTALDGLLETL